MLQHVIASCSSVAQAVSGGITNKGPVEGERQGDPTRRKSKTPSTGTHPQTSYEEAKCLTEANGVCTLQVKKDNEEITSMEKMYVFGVAIFVSII